MREEDTLEALPCCMLSNDGRSIVDFPKLAGTQSLNTPLSVAPMISGLLLVKWTWPSIFWFLSVASPLVLLSMFLFLPETCRRLVGNGSSSTSRVNTPLLLILCPEHDSSITIQQEKQTDILKLPNPLSVLALLKDRATLVAVLCYGVYYTVYSCLQASTSTLFVAVYQLSGLQAGLIYIPFGVACSMASIVAGAFPSHEIEVKLEKLNFVIGRILDRDYRVVAKAQGFPIDRVRGDDLSTFPIEHARLRTHKYSIIICASLIATYGWILRARLVKRPFRRDCSSQLTTLEYSSTSSLPNPDWIFQPGPLHCETSICVH